MPYSESLAARIRAQLEGRSGASEKKMFGGIAFFLNGNMCCGVLREEMILKVKGEAEEQMLRQKGCRPFDFTGRPMKGMVYVQQSVLTDEDALAEWLEPALKAAAALPAKQPKPGKPRGKKR